MNRGRFLAKYVWARSPQSRQARGSLQGCERKQNDSLSKIKLKLFFYFNVICSDIFRCVLMLTNVIKYYLESSYVIGIFVLILSYLEIRLYRLLAVS